MGPFPLEPKSNDSPILTFFEANICFFAGLIWPSNLAQWQPKPSSNFAQHARPNGSFLLRLSGLPTDLQNSLESFCSLAKLVCYHPPANVTAHLVQSQIPAWLSLQSVTLVHPLVLTPVSALLQPSMQRKSRCTNAISAAPTCSHTDCLLTPRLHDHRSN